MKNTFLLHDRARFSRVFILAVLVHLIFLLKLDSHPHSSPTWKHKVATLLQPTLETHSNDRSPKVALRISPRRHASVVLQGKENDTVQQGGLSPSPPMPLQRRIISAAAHEAKDAAYLARWQAYVEKYGNTHYPSIALKDNLQGDLRLLVAINRDGTLREVAVRQSSGSSILDQAAVNIVLQAAPFDPLPSELASEVDVLEIIRTWQFRGALSTSG
jgi:TonB family protein